MENNLKYFIDTNVIMYAAGKEHKYKEPCSKILYDINNNFNCSFFINTETIQEILYRYTKIDLKKFGIKLANYVIKLFDNISAITIEDVKQSISLMEKYDFLISRDALIIANMIGNNIKNIISTDKVFNKIAEIIRIDPLDM